MHHKDFPGGPVVKTRLSASTVGGMGSIPRQGTKDPASHIPQGLAKIF